MKKFIVSLLSVMVILAIVLPSQALGSDLSNQEKVLETPANEKAQKDFSDIKKVEKYISVDANGHIVLDPKHSKNFHKKYDLDALEAHFELLNEKVDNGTIKINNDLSIEDLSITLFASYNKWTYHWWGYDRNFTNSQAIRYVNDLNTVATGGAIAAGAASLFPIIGAGVAMTAGYYGLMATRVTANNRGNGVYVAQTWARVFNVKPL
ncbi:hypothetical protein FQV26_14180 [Planococcus sp. CPCC 101016]|uniref:hypothetical protein n=1 Tax=Planococcus sp. CPCC 101016 TaxID=2599617 RepID=UPI0011B664EA|nr:hypothetical protein [Planococcus sp. CPCC 101016]TWT05572.1 hypothetical protein FQV26_14180 [Planococcus sp. CPCC 101016]